MSHKKARNGHRLINGGRFHFSMVVAKSLGHDALPQRCCGGVCFRFSATLLAVLLRG
jgi:hypothetical protein